MTKCTLGQIVFSKCGHDRGRIYIVVAISGEYLYLADGNIRTVENPKKKKFKHIQITNYVSEDIENKLKLNRCTNFDLVGVLKLYRGKFLTKEV